MLDKNILSSLFLLLLTHLSALLKCRIVPRSSKLSYYKQKFSQEAYEMNSRSSHEANCSPFVQLLLGINVKEIKTNKQKRHGSCNQVRSSLYSSSALSWLNNAQQDGSFLCISLSSESNNIQCKGLLKGLELMPVKGLAWCLGGFKRSLSKSKIIYPLQEASSVSLVTYNKSWGYEANISGK